MTPAAPVWISGTAGRLEGLLWGAGAERSLIGAVVCHPHPLHGGDQHNNVVDGVRRALAGRDWAVLTFNFRGVGRSDGEHGGGAGEVKDVEAAARFLSTTSGVPAERLLLVGYSFGAWVTSRAACRGARAGAVALVAPPLAAYPLEEEADGYPGPVLAVVGSEDSYCPADLFQAWVDRIPGPKEASVLSGADHFLRGREADVGRLVASFAARHLAHLL
ncbi:MAG: alpha/beta fold hydrolase [Deltaproteobacteria bacterium]|nr:alpha/beta fold hydrolase [Deltaproteobacteria bacterium]